MRTLTHIYTYMHIYIYTYIRVYVYTYMYAYVYTHVFFYLQGSGKRVAALTDVLDLAGIAACDAHIMSTSSFSWCVEVCYSILQCVAAF